MTYLLRTHHYKQIKISVEYFCKEYELTEEELFKILDNGAVQYPFFNMDNLVVFGGFILLQKDDPYYPFDEVVNDFSKPWYDNLKRSIFTYRSKKTREGLGRL